MDGKTLARIGAVIFVAIAITAAVIEMNRPNESVPATATPQLQPPSDPLRQSLRRCQQLGDAAVSDSGCLAAWAESRDRFLGRSPAPRAPHNNREQ